MLKKLSKRDRIALIGLGAFLGLLGLVFGVVLPFFDARQAMESQLEQQIKALQRSVETIQNQDIYRSRLAELDLEMQRLQLRLLDASNPSLAQTQLLEILKSLEQQNGVSITRSSPIPERSEGNYTKVTMQINLECDIVGLTGFLRSVAEHQKFLQVEEFSLNVGRSRRSRRETLRPRLRISAWIRLS